MFKLTGMYLVVILLAGCTLIDDIELQHSQIAAELAETEKRLVAMLDQRCQIDHQKLAADISSLINTEKSLPSSAKSEPQVVYIERSSSAAATGGITMGDKLILGQIERVTLTKEQRTFDARIDTGAVTSSLGVYNINLFERDGKKWVEFSLDKDKNAITYQYPIKRFIRIAISSVSKASRREVIELNFSLGNESYYSEFSLADRSHLDYQVLIGREFLLDRAVVDVSGNYLIKRE